MLFFICSRTSFLIQRYNNYNILLKRWRGVCYMDKTSMSESFGEQLAAITEGTKYELKVDTENIDIGNIESRIRTVMYTLWMDGQAKHLANYLERKKAERFADLNKFSYGVSFQEDALYRITNNTESLAIKNIYKKETYIKRINNARHQFDRFKSICNQLSSEDRELIVNYFEHSHKVAYELLRDTIQRNLTTLERIYTEADREKVRRIIQEERGCTKQEAKLYHAQHGGKQQYFIFDRYVYLTEAEYAALQQQEEERRTMWEKKYHGISDDKISAIE